MDKFECNCNSSVVNYETAYINTQNELQKVLQRNNELEQELGVFTKYFCKERDRVYELIKRLEHIEDLRKRGCEVCQKIRNILFSEKSNVRMSKNTRNELLYLINML